MKESPFPDRLSIRKPGKIFRSVNTVGAKKFPDRSNFYYKIYDNQEMFQASPVKIRDSTTSIFRKASDGTWT